MRNNRPGSIQSAVHSSYRAVGGLENASADLGLATSTLSYGTEMSEARPAGIGVNYLDRLGRMRPDAAEPIAQHFASLAGGVFQPVQTSDNVTSLLGQSGTIAKECGEAQCALLKAAESVNAGHCDEAIREIDEAVASLLAAKASVVAMRDKRRVA